LTKIIRFLTIFILFSLSANVQLSFAQPGTTTEAEVNAQKIFIEANKEKILENYEMAVTLFKEVLKNDPQNHAAAYELARVYDVIDNDEKALSSIKIAVGLQPENMWYKLFLADVYDKASKFDGAADIYKQMIEKYPDVEYHYFKYAYYLVKDNKQEEAIKVYNKIEKNFGLNEEVTRRKHSLYLGTGDVKNAAKEIQLLIDSDPEKIKYHHLLADFYTSIGEKEQAKKVYTKILELDPLDAKAKIALAGDQASQGNDVAYLTSLESVFYQKDESIDIKIKAFMPYIVKVGDSDDEAFKEKAVELGRVLTEVHPDDAKAYSVYGDLLYQMRDNQGAMEAYEKTLTINKGVYSVWEQMLYILAEDYNMEKMAEISEKGMDVFPNNSKLYYFYGIASTELENHSEASSALEQALLMSGKNENLKVDVLARLARSYAQQNKIEKANKKIGKALQLKPNDFRVQEAKGYVLFKNKENKSAKEWYEKSLKNGGQNNFEVVEHYGDLLYQMGEEKEAFEQWTKSKALGGNSDRLNKKLISKQPVE